MTRARVTKRDGRRKLTEEQWSTVFRLRCKRKQGASLSEEEQSLVDAAYNSDPGRYALMERDVFNSTVPFGSTARWP